MVRRAVAVGINVHKYLSPLSFAGADARRFASAITESEAGFQVELILDGSRESPTLSVAEVLNAANRLASAAQAGDELLFYFSGHGCIHTSGSANTVVLAAYDTRLDELSTTALDLARLVKVLADSSARHIVIVIDACRARSHQQTQGDDTKGMDEALKAAIPPAICSTPPTGIASADKTIEILTACSDGQVAIEVRVPSRQAGPGGAWTTGFLKAMSHYADALRKSLKTEPRTVRQLFGDAQLHIPERLRSRFTPWYYCTGSSLVLLTKARKPPKKPSKVLQGPSIRTYAAPVQLLSDSRVSLVRVPYDTIYQNETVHLVPFCSPYHAHYLEDFRSLGIAERNRQFDFRLFLPNLSRFKPPFHNLFILINGLAEANSKILDEVGLQLSKQGIPAILMPLPRHFTRFMQSAEHDDPFRPDDQSEKLYSQQLLQTVYAHPEHLVYMFEQLDQDVAELLIDIDRGRTSPIEGLFDPGSRVSLFGYSIGGLCALGMTLADFEHHSRQISLRTMSVSEIETAYATACAGMRFSSTILLESGLPLDEIDTSKLYRRTDKVSAILTRAYCGSDMTAEFHRGFATQKFERLYSDRESDQHEAFTQVAAGTASAIPTHLFARSQLEADCVWRDIIMDLHGLVKGDAGKLRDVSPLRLDLFRRVFLGDHPTRTKVEVDALSRKLLLFTGGEDEIFPASSLLAGPLGGLATLQVPGMSHWLKVSGAAHWTYWYRMIVDLSVRFEEAYADSRVHIAK